MRKIAAVAVSGLLIACFATGCKSQPAMSNQPMTGNVNEPKWVTNPYAEHPEQRGKVLYGVAMAEFKVYGESNLRQKTAEMRARDEVASAMKTMTAAIFEDYSKAAFTPSMKSGEVQTLTENVQRTITAETLIGSIIEDHWVNPQTGNMYALCSLSMDSVANMIRDKIVAVEKDNLATDAATAHKKLDKIIEDKANGK